MDAIQEAEQADMSSVASQAALAAATAAEKACSCQRALGGSSAKEYGPKRPEGIWKS